MSNYEYMDGGASTQMPPIMPQLPMGGMSSISPPSNDSTIASMRWESQQLVYELYKVLGGYDVRVKPDGSISFHRENRNARPKINDEGIESVISIIRSVVNPVTSLSNMNDDEANEMIAQLLHSLVRHLAYNVQRFEINDGDLDLITNIVKPILFSQFKRAVAGHESMNFHTQTLEHNVQQNVNQQSGTSGGFSFLPFGKKRGF